MGMRLSNLLVTHRASRTSSPATSYSSSVSSLFLFCSTFMVSLHCTIDHTDHLLEAIPLMTAHLQVPSAGLHCSAGRWRSGAGNYFKLECRLRVRRGRFGFITAPVLATVMILQCPDTYRKGVAQKRLAYLFIKCGTQTKKLLHSLGVL